MSHCARLYGLLGLPSSPVPEPEEIRKAYHKTALRLHPDKNPTDPQATARFQDVVKAYEMLMSGSVTIEEVPEDIVTNNNTTNKNTNADTEYEGLFYHGHSEDELSTSKLPRRMAKQEEKSYRNWLNGVQQHRTGLSMAYLRYASKQREADALRQRIKTEKFYLKLQRRGNPLQVMLRKKDPEYVIAICEQRIFILNKSINDPNRKQFRPDLGNAETSKQAMLRQMVQARTAAKLAEERRYVESLESDDPEEYQRIMAHKLAREEEEIKEAQELAHKVKVFWDSRKAKEVLPPPATVFQKTKGREDSDAKDAALRHTRNHLFNKPASDPNLAKVVVRYEKRHYRKPCTAMPQPLEPNVKGSGADYVDAECESKRNKVQQQEAVKMSRQERRAIEQEAINTAWNSRHFYRTRRIQNAGRRRQEAIEM